ncbi:MAG: NAD(P)H-dependent oxidoreductase [Burkholderiales bacterium]
MNTSIYSSGGQSSRLADELVSAWCGRNPRSRVIRRDLATDPVPHLTAERFAAFLSKPDERTSVQQSVVDYSDALIDELKRADVIVRPRTADVQLRRAFVPQSVFRSHCKSGRDFPVHGKRTRWAAYG